ncbi:MAG: hypothetical protein HQL31_02420 [Planctomycetes bacterium]|nr:hypothetical protein [Planctomycetota bacterium]
MSKKCTNANNICIERKTWLRGEYIECRLQLAAETTPLTRMILRGLNVPGEWDLDLSNDGKVQIETGPRRAGDYELILFEGESLLARSELYIRPAEKPQVWYGNYLGQPEGHGFDPYEKLRELSMNAAYRFKGMHPDESLRGGIYLVYHGDAIRGLTGKLDEADKEKLLQRYKNCLGEVKRAPFACMRNPEVIRRAGDMLHAQLEPLASFPGLMGVGIDDEATMRGYDCNDSGGVTCYCPSCVAQWKERTGSEPPTPPLVEPGSIIPDDDPYLQYLLQWTGWFEYGGGPAEVEYDKIMEKRLRELREDLCIFQVPGAIFGELEVVHVEIYSFLYNQPVTDALSTMSLTRAMRKKPTPIWPLIGWFRYLPTPKWTGDLIRAQANMCLAEGAEAIWLTLMYWLDENDECQPGILREAEHMTPAIKDIGHLLETYGPALKRVKPLRYPVAVLRSRTTEGYQQILDPAAITEARSRGSWVEGVWQHGQATSMGFGALLKAGLPAEFITEDEVLAGKLDAYEALVLLDHRYSPRGVVDRIDAYAASGKPVYADRSTLIRPVEAIDLPFDSSQVVKMVNLGLRATRKTGLHTDIVYRRMVGLEDEWAFLTRRFLDERMDKKQRILSSDNQNVIVRIGRSGEVDYVFVLSTDVMGIQEAEITAQVRGNTAYDMLSCDTEAITLQNDRLESRVSLPAGGMRVFMITPQPVSELKMEVYLNDGEVEIDVDVYDDTGRIIPGSFPLNLEVKGPDGKTLPYGGNFGTEEGHLHHNFRPAINDPQGEWIIRTSHLTTGHAAMRLLAIQV